MWLTAAEYRDLWDRRDRRTAGRGRFHMCRELPPPFTAERGRLSAVVGATMAEDCLRSHRVLVLWGSTFPAWAGMICYPQDADRYVSLAPRVGRDVLIPSAQETSIMGRSMPRHEQMWTTRYRKGERTPQSREAKAAYDRHWHRRIVVVEMAPIEMPLLDDLAAGMPIAEAAGKHGTTTVAIHGRAQWDSGWRMRVDDALMVGRPDNARHGTEAGYRWDGCRGPCCRAAHDATRVSPGSREVPARTGMPPLWGDASLLGLAGVHDSADLLTGETQGGGDLLDGAVRAGRDLLGDGPVSCLSGEHDGIVEGAEFVKGHGPQYAIWNIDVTY